MIVVGVPEMVTTELIVSVLADMVSVDTAVVDFVRAGAVTVTVTRVVVGE